MVVNWVDPGVFHFNEKITKEAPFTFAAVATRWNRLEKRLSAISKFAQDHFEIEIVLIGTIFRSKNK